jgi:branched-subunit amino acid permease
MWLFIAVLATYCAGVVTFDLKFYYGAVVTTGAQAIVRGIHLLGFAIPLVLLVGVYSRAVPLNQARIRWVLFSLLGLMATYLLNIVPRLWTSRLSC